MVWWHTRSWSIESRAKKRSALNPLCKKKLLEGRRPSNSKSCMMPETLVRPGRRDAAY